MSKKNINKLKNMVDGWTNVFITDEEVEALAKERELVCNVCEHRKKRVCTLCSCPLKAKLRAPNDSCPDNRWLR